jgi:HEAT repeat protein
MLLALALAASRAEAQSDGARSEPVYEGKPLSAWIVQLKDAAPQNRSAAAYAISSMGSAAQSSVPALTVALADENPTVRYAAAWALGEIGPAAQRAVSALRRAREEDPHVDVRWSAGKALRKIRGS